MNRKIYLYNAPCLKKVCIPVFKDDDNFDQKVLDKLISDMVETVEYHQGLGLAASQVGELVRVIVIRDVKTRKVFEVINPEVEWYSSMCEPGYEMCLSYPKLRKKINRPVKGEISGYNMKWEKVTYEVEGLQARIFFHEMDHLNGRCKVGT